LITHFIAKNAAVGSENACRASSCLLSKRKLSLSWNKTLQNWLWGQLKHNVYTKQPKTLDDLQSFIVREVRDIDVTVMKSAVMNLVDRLNLVIQLGGGHIEHTF
jgi:hypothetical protein